jgi:hypothetical protein
MDDVLLPELWFHVIVPMLTDFRQVLALARTCRGYYRLLWPEAICQQHVPTTRDLATPLRRGFETVVLPRALRVHTLHGRIYYRLCGEKLAAMAARLTTVCIDSEYSLVNSQDLRRLTNITALNIRNNHFIDLAAVCSLPSLRHLWTNGGIMTAYRTDRPAQLLPPALETLVVAFTPVGFDDVLLNLPQLRRLSVAEAATPIAPATFLAMTQLTHVQLYPRVMAAAHAQETLRIMAGWLQCLDISHSGLPRAEIRRMLAPRIASGALRLITMNPGGKPCADFEPP